MRDPKTADLNTIRAAFMRRASAPHISAFALKLAYLLAYKHMDIESRTARLSQETLARDLGDVTVRTVQRMLNVLRPLGLAIVHGHGPNRSSTYWIDPDKATPQSPIGGGKGDSGRQRRRHLTTEKATLQSPLLKKNLQEESPKEEGRRFTASPLPERDGAKNAPISSPGDGAGAVAPPAPKNGR
jgi:hypothetical protein